MSIVGYTTRTGAENYRRRFTGKAAPEHFSQQQGLWLSSIGIGTYLGDHDEATDQLYRGAVVRAVELGCNVIDSAINYRLQRSERSIAAALKELAGQGIGRDELFIATKGGFLPFDGAPPKDIRAYFTEVFMKPGIAAFSDFVAGCHCMTPSYLTNQIDCSLRNLGVDCVDLYYVHNPETQLGHVGRADFNQRLRAAFEALESAVAAGKIRMYGTATWNGYRNEIGAQDHLSLAEIVALAEEAGGTNHHFKAIQLPFNMAMPEAVTLQNQEVNGHTVTLVEAAAELGVTVICSAAILQGQLAGHLPDIAARVFAGLATDAQRALQFVRSTPGVGVALVGMKQVRHVEENLKVAELAPVTQDQYAELFTAS